MSRFVIALSAALALAGCEGVRRIDTPPSPGGYSFSKAIAATGGLQRVEIAGAPPDGATPEQVAAALRGPSNYAPTRFESAPHGGTGLRYVLEFGNPRASRNACERPQGQVQTAPPMVVTAVFCSYASRIQSATLTAPDLAGPSSEDFTDAMALLFRQLLPQERRRIRGLFGGDDD